MELYNAIFTRKSIRKFKKENLSQDQCAAIIDFAVKAKPLCADIKTKMMVVSPSEVKSLMAIKSPHYLLLYSERKEGYLLNAGFILQQVDLYLSHQGIGSCWLGMIKPKVTSVEGLGFAVMLAIGTPQESIHRKDLTEFDRKSLSEISQGDDPRIEAARLAPSASNRQPWYFVCQQKNINVYRKKPSGPMGAIYNRLTQLDLGIALCHLKLAGENLGVEFNFNNRIELSPKEDYLPVGTVHR